MIIEFTDGSYIEKNTSGDIYVGVVANELGHIMRKNNFTLEQVIEVFNSMVDKRVLELTNVR